MGLLLHFIFLNLYVLLSIAFVELPVKYFKDGSKSSFIQAPYISTVQDQRVKEIQEEITTSWPEGVVTYYLDDKSYDSSIGNRIRTAMSVLEEATCVRFRVAEKEPENATWIHITNPKKKRECQHGTKFLDKGAIMLILGYDCLEQEDIIHSILHGIGFRDEVTHPQRDKYIRVLWDNIQPVYRYLYRVQPLDASSVVEYDPLSVMHFHDRAFSSNGKATILPLESGLIISPSKSLSQLDKMRLQLYFGHECNKRKFGSLIETCKNSLKDNHEIESVKDSPDVNHDAEKVDEHTVENEERNTEENVESVNMKENEKEMDNSEDNIQIKNKKENQNSEENIVNTNNEKQNKDNTGENIENNIKENLEDKDNSKEDNESNNSTGHIKTLGGYVVVPLEKLKDHLKGEGPDSRGSSQNKEDLGINLNNETD